MALCKIMSKRKLTKQQISRIEQARAKQLSHLENPLPIHETGESQQQLGLVVSYFGRETKIETPEGRVISCRLRQNLGNLVVGDLITWEADQEDNGVITARRPRTSEFFRVDKRGQTKLIAANIAQVIIVIAPEPTPPEGLLDSYLVAAELLALTPIILLNKVDLTEHYFEFFQLYEDIYRSTSYPLLRTSALEDPEMGQLKNILADKTSVLVGPSGTGKSSLISRLSPHSSVGIGPLGAKSRLGTHTTSTTQLYRLQDVTGHILDSPGIREFGLWNIKPEQLQKGFIEFRDFLELCQFSNCTHTHEPNCGLQIGLEQGKIHPKRLENYRLLFSKYKK